MAITQAYWLLLNQLNSVARVKNLVSLYVHEPNDAIPHSAFDSGVQLHRVYCP